MVGNEAGLAAYYRLDQIDGSTTYDLTSNANHGTLTNMDPATDWVTSDAFDTWIGAESSLWSDAGNWSKGAAPTSSNSVGLYKWALGNEATISTSPTIKNLYISSTASPTLSSSTTINLNFLLGKDFNLNGQTVTLGSAATLVEGAYRLYGTSGTISTTKTLSNIAVLDVAGLGAKISTTANLGSTTITRGHAQQTGSSGNVSILRYYDITPTNNSSLNATLVFNYNNAELNSITENNLKLFRSTDSGTTWTNEGGTVNTANNYVTKTAIPSFSRWTLADSAYPISKTTPVITFAPAPTPTYLGGDFTVSASTTNTDSSALTYSRVSGPCAFVSGATFSSTGAGTCVVQADGAATTNFNAASQTQSITIGKAGTATTITSDTPNPSVVGQAVTVSYAVTANPPGGDTPAGNVTVSDGVNNCTNTVAAGSCSLTLTTSGAHTLTATYAGDANFNGSSGTASHTVLFQYLLSVSISGSGTVTGNRTGIEGNGINCGSDCSETFNQGTAVTLSAAPANSWKFEGWSGDPDCSDGQVTVNSPLNCTATFVLNNSVTIPAATGNGNITLDYEQPRLRVYYLGRKDRDPGGQ